MNPHKTCGVCTWNKRNRCSNEASRYHCAPLKAWNTCSEHAAPQPSTSELIARLGKCAAGLDHRAKKAEGEYRAYFADRAQQCRSWLADIKSGHASPERIEDIAGGLVEFEGLAL